MEVQNLQPGEIIDTSVDVSGGGSRVTGKKKVFRNATCGFLDAAAISKDAKEQAASMHKLLMVVVLYVVFMSVEIVAGIKANSLTIQTDGAHLLSDAAAFVISSFSLWVAGREATPCWSYGFLRVEILSQLASIQLIWLLARILVYETIVWFIHDAGDVDGSLVFKVAAFGRVVNIIIALLLASDHGHGHDDHDNGFGQSDGRTTTTHHHHRHLREHSKDEHHNQEELSMNKHHPASEENLIFDNGKCKHAKKQGAYLHVLADSMQSIRVMVGSGIIWDKPEWR